MSKNKQKKYSESFKREVVDYGLNSPKSHKAVCREFDIALSSYQRWRRELLSDAKKGNSQDPTADEPSKMELANQIHHLQKQLLHVQRQNEILKKAALILGEKPPTNMS